MPEALAPPPAPALAAAVSAEAPASRRVVLESLKNLCGVCLKPRTNLMFPPKRWLQDLCVCVFVCFGPYALVFV